MSGKFGKFAIVGFCCYILSSGLITSLVFANNGDQKIEPLLVEWIANLSDDDIVTLTDFMPPLSGGWQLEVQIKREVVGTEIVEGALLRSFPNESLRTEKVVRNITTPIISQEEVQVELQLMDIPYETIDYHPQITAIVIISDGTLTKRQIYELAGLSWVNYIKAIPVAHGVLGESTYYSNIILGLIGILMVSAGYYIFKRKRT